MRVSQQISMIRYRYLANAFNDRNTCITRDLEITAILALIVFNPSTDLGYQEPEECHDCSACDVTAVDFT
jgi:hypothetical protein